MNTTKPTIERAVHCKVVPLLVLLLSGFLFPCGSVTGADPVGQALCDLEVLYLYDGNDQIDWPILYYLNEESSCTIELLNVKYGDFFRQQSRSIPEKGIYLNSYTVDSSIAQQLDSVLTLQFSDRRPDVVIIGGSSQSGPTEELVAEILNLSPATETLFNIRKVYRCEEMGTEGGVARRSVTINRKEMYDRYRDRMEIELPNLDPWVSLESLGETGLVHYKLLRPEIEGEAPDPDFLYGLEQLRLVPVLEDALEEGALKTALLNRANKAVSALSIARRSKGAERVTQLSAAHREFTALKEQIQAEGRLVAGDELQSYLDRLVSKVQNATLMEIGIDWDGQIILRDSPHGPKLKFRASLSVFGSIPVELSYVRFEPYWDSNEIILDADSRLISPHQTFVKEYSIEIESEYLETEMPDSPSFAAEIVYDQNSMTVRSAVPVHEFTNLAITFEPDFFFIKPSARVDVDRVVSSLNCKAVISKPLYYYGTVTLDLQTPRGMFAGAYRQTWQLEKGRATETVRIPFSVSNLLEMGIHHQTITLSLDNRIVASDTARIRIASCEVGDTITVGLMPDSTGVLEDVLRMAQVRYWPLTDRILQTGDLDAYDVILIGSGALETFPSFSKIKGRLEEYLRFGGSLVLLGQPTDWPAGVLPVNFSHTSRSLETSEIINRLPEARILSKPYRISQEQ